MDAVKHDTPKTKVEWVNVIAKRCKECITRFRALPAPCHKDKPDLRKIRLGLLAHRYYDLLPNCFFEFFAVGVDSLSLIGHIFEAGRRLRSEGCREKGKPVVRRGRKA